MKILVSNKYSNRNYFIIKQIEAGISLKGTEVKSLSKSQASIDGSFIIFKKNEAYILNMYIASFFEGNRYNVDTNRTRKLLLHKHEIINLAFAIKKQKLTCIPIKIYWKNNKIKVLIALAKGKKLHDKREDIKKRDQEREIKSY